jgi:hypothetical protein
MSTMKKSERDALAQLVRRRERLAKADVDRVAAERLAQFEKDAASFYRAEDDAVWAEQNQIVEKAVAEANSAITARSHELGIPDWAAPRIGAQWYHRGQNAVKERVIELRRVAKTHIDAEARSAKHQIELSSVEIQTQLVADGLETEAAQGFLAAMPTAEQLMPAVTVAEIEMKS